MKIEMSEAALQARREYQRAQYQKNKDKERVRRAQYWERVAARKAAKEEMAAEGSGS